MALYMCQVLHIVDFLGSRRMETAPTSIEVLLRPTQSQSDEPSDLRGSLSPTIVYTAPGSPRRSPIRLSVLMNPARRRLTAVIEQISMSERRIQYITGCDTISSFLGQGIKLGAWTLVINNHNFRDALVNLG